MTHLLDSYVPQLDRAVVEARYKQLCNIRDDINKKIEPIKKELQVAADLAETQRVASMKIAQRLYEARGGDKWFKLKKEIGILAKTLSGILPPTPEQIAQANDIAKAVK